ncbi:MAG: General stress protein 26 [Chloroflexi bacterium]|nr:MAG: General stress protein 26 [Chloroflexota bacterium]
MSDRPDFWDEAAELIDARPIGFLATVDGDQPIVRAVTPAWDGITAFIATDPSTPKVRQIQRNPLVDLIHWGQDFRHVGLRARAQLITDPETLEHLWGAFPYELSDYFDRSDTPAQGKAAFSVIRLQPFRIELWSLPSLATGTPPQVWRAD